MARSGTEESVVTKPVLETKRLVLRPLSRDDLTTVHRIFDDPSVRRYLFDDEPVSIGTAESLLTNSERDFASGSVGLFGVRLRDEAALIGFCGFFVVQGIGEPEMTYGLLPAYRRRGVGLEAARAAARYALEKAGFWRVLVAADQANSDSLRVIRNLGATPLGEISPQQPKIPYFQLKRWVEERRSETKG